jgi:hypothetical protein
MSVPQYFCCVQETSVGLTLRCLYRVRHGFLAGRVMIPSNISASLHTHLGFAISVITVGESSDLDVVIAAICNLLVFNNSSVRLFVYNFY